MKRICTTLSALLLLAGCVTMTDPRITPAHNKMAWQGSLVAIPAAFNAKSNYQIRKNLGYSVNFPDINAMVKPDARIPLVIWAHPCSGITGSSNTFFQSAIAAGYAVIAPNSFANGRQGECRVGKALGQYRPLRMGEIRYALEQIRAIPWVDLNNIVLAGYSEGSGAVREYGAQSPEINGIMIFGVACSNYAAVAVQADMAVHVLAVFGEEDRYYRHTDTFQACSVAGHAAPSQSISMPKGGHDVMAELPIQKLITQMLQDWRRPS
jgi:dienelactone hydrolase